MWVHVVQPRFAPDSLGLDRGETHAIWLAEELGIKSILIDERKGRRIAAERGLLVAGTLALIERFAERGWIDFENVITRLRATSFRFSEGIVAEIRQRLADRRGN